MADRVYVSTGTMVGRENGFDYVRALRELAVLQEEGFCDGIELMMLIFYYDKLDRVVGEVVSSGVTPAVIHCEKEIGTMLSECGTLRASNRLDEEKARYSETLDLFRMNCDTGCRLGVKRMVLHLWGGMHSDHHIDYNAEKLPELSEIALGYGLRILVENIPSQKADPRRNWHTVLPLLGNGGFVFDTRFGMLHRQIEGILDDSDLVKRIEHVHISDFAGTYREFRALRPILHPGEGHIDFEMVASLLRRNGYGSSITVESPVISGTELDTDKMRKTLSYVRDRFIY